MLKNSKKNSGRNFRLPGSTVNSVIAGERLVGPMVFHLTDDSCSSVVFFHNIEDSSNPRNIFLLIRSLLLPYCLSETKVSPYRRCTILQYFQKQSYRETGSKTTALKWLRCMAWIWSTALGDLLIMPYWAQYRKSIETGKMSCFLFI